MMASKAHDARSALVGDGGHVPARYRNDVGHFLQFLAVYFLHEHVDHGLGYLVIWLRDRRQWRENGLGKERAVVSEHEDVIRDPHSSRKGLPLDGGGDRIGRENTVQAGI